MTVWIPKNGDIITAIISLECRGEERLRIPRVYAALREMKERDVLLSGLSFSITGSVCYSREIDGILRILVEKGMLVLTDRDTLFVRDSVAEEVRARLRKKLPSAVYRSLQAASRRFYGEIFPDHEGSLDPSRG